jgi:hypothetical protein
VRPRLAAAALGTGREPRIGDVEHGTALAAGDQERSRAWLLHQLEPLESVPGWT